MHNGQIPCVIASDMSSFSANPRHQQHVDAIKKLTELCAKVDIAAKCREKWPILGTSHLSTPKRAQNTSLPISPYSSGSNGTPKAMTLSVDRTYLKMNKLGNYRCAPTLPPINSPVYDLVRKKFKPPQVTPPSVICQSSTSKFASKSVTRDLNNQDSSSMEVD